MKIVHEEKPVQIKRSDPPATMVHPEWADCDWQWLRDADPHDSRGLSQPTHQHSTTLLSTSVRLDRALSIADQSTLKMFAWTLSHPAIHNFGMNMFDGKEWVAPVVVEDFDLMINTHQTKG